MRMTALLPVYQFNLLCCTHAHLVLWMATAFLRCIHWLQQKKSTFNTQEPRKQGQKWQSTANDIFSILFIPVSCSDRCWGTEQAVALQATWALDTISCIQGSTKAITGKRQHISPEGCFTCIGCYPILSCYFERTLVLFFFFLFFMVFYWSQGSCLQSSVLWWPWFLLCWGSLIASERKLPFHLLNEAAPSLSHWPWKRMHIGQLNLPLVTILHFSVSYLPLPV